MMEPFWLESDDVCAIYGETIAASGGDPGILDEGALESTLNKPKNLYRYGDGVTLYLLAASYGYGLIKNHCFLDGNKRIALIAIYTFLSINGIELTASEVDAASFFLELAATCDPQGQVMDRLVNWLVINSESIGVDEWL
jgi:death on curing protein